MKRMDGKRFSLMIFSIISTFFLISGIISSMNYADVLLYRNKIIEENPNDVKVDKKNGTIIFSFMIKNPSPFNIDFYSLTAIFLINNKTVATFQRSYYYFQQFPLEVERYSMKNITYDVKPDAQFIPLISNSSHFNVTLHIKVRFSGFLYYYENPEENYSPERYYLTEMVMMEIDWSGRA